MAQLFSMTSFAWPGSSDRNFYDRSYFNAHDRTGDIFVISGIGYYPNLGVKDAFLLVARRGGGRFGGSGDEQTAVHLSGAIDQDRHIGLVANADNLLDWQNEGAR